MGKCNALTSLLEENHGYITTGAASAAGVKRWELSRLVQQGMLSRAAQGLYVNSDLLPDPLVVAQHRCASGVFSHETALFLHDLSDRVPLQMMMTIPSGWNTPMLKDDNMMFFYVRKDWFELGVVSLKTHSGPLVRCYDTERTLCDCIRGINRLDRDLVMTAMKTAMKQGTINKPKLLHYADVFGIRELMFQYSEVLT